MALSTLIESKTGTQVLPFAGDERATISPWVAHLACDADARTNVPAYAEVAGLLKVSRE